MQQALPTSSFRVYRYACVIKFHLGKWRLIRDQIFVVVETASFIVSEDIISILVDQNFTINATGILMVLEPLFNKQKNDLSEK